MHGRIIELKSYIDNEDWINIFYPDSKSVRVYPYKILPDDMNVAFGYNPDIVSEEDDIIKG